jgi:hypothetical protein
MFFLCLDRLLVRHRRYLVFLAIVAGLVRTNALGITNILGIGDNHAVVRLVVKINGFLIAGIQGYLISVPLNIVS